MNYQKFLNSNINVRNKKIIITGATSGLGLDTLKLLAKMGNDLVIAGRSIDKINSAITEVKKLNDNVNVSYILYNQDDLNSVNLLANSIINEHNDFDILFLNAGVYLPKQALTKNNLPYTVGVNFISNMFLLNKLEHLLIDNKKKIIFQGSLTSRSNIIKYDLLDEVGLNKQYAISKRALYSLFLKYSSYNYKTDFLYVEPGISNSNIYRRLPKFIVWLANKALKTLMNNSKIAILNAVIAMNDDVNNGDVYLPRGFKRFRGYPKLYNFKNKYYEEKYLKQGEDILSKI